MTANYIQLPTDSTGKKVQSWNNTIGADDVHTQANTLVTSSGVETGTSGSPLRIDPTGTTTQPVSAASLPLPTGAATGAKQDTGNTSLSSIDGKTPALGQAAMAASAPVVIASDQSAVPVSGTVTANAGTNLNTSALALESGGNLAGAATSLAVIDDWDEADRAKVNPIVGQAGVQGASGVVTATTQRVTLATDVALPAGTNAIGKLASNDGVDIGDVTINNASGASAVNIQDGGNSITVDGTVTASNTAGNVAHDSADSGNPVKVGAKATASLTTQTNVAAADRSDLFTDVSGRLVTSPYSVPESLVKGTATLTGTGDTAVIAAGGANIKTYITQITVTNTSGTAVRVDVKDGTTIIWAAYLAASGGGATATFLAPLRGTANTAVNAALSAAVTDVRVHVSGYQINN